MTELPQTRTDACPDLVIAVVGAVGTALSDVESEIAKALRRVGYQPSTIRLSKLMEQIPKQPWSELPKGPAADRYHALMSAGNELREKMRRGDALALLGVNEINQRKKQGVRGNAYILHSLKHPEEVNTLRRIYGPTFLLVAAYSPRDCRLKNLTEKLAGSVSEVKSDRFRKDAEPLIARDEEELGFKFGQNVRDTFWRADFFVDASKSKDLLENAVERFFQLFFGRLHTPSIDEYGMFFAWAAAFRSASLARQVGAVIASKEGSVVAVGTNEVPKAMGGLYWPNRDYDERDCKKQHDISDRMRQHLLGDVLTRLKAAGWLSDQRETMEVNELVTEALVAGAAPIMKGAQFMSLIEYGRSVHAEMAALMDAVYRGIPVAGCTLYTSTFPCHECARHIIASGIDRVVYVAPYPKSLVQELHDDAISVDGAKLDRNHIQFEPFVGVAPSRYMDLFAMVEERKKKDGSVIEWDPATASPRLGVYPVWVSGSQETLELAQFRDQMLELISDGSRAEAENERVNEAN